MFWDIANAKIAAGGAALTAASQVDPFEFFERASDINDDAIRRLAEWFQEQYRSLYAEVTAESQEWAEEMKEMEVKTLDSR
ncbi:hypothetical protein K469DRAFT_699755 [Zopfia rhizophila CBS 207.26]|uniref:Uncharacterized protein n=1 Tax=Zopfia rhizophila CBS 207.26 TaxID=1314779 RepID=A0A6A6EJR1_9PEZI|nr:hypothetical protein K469DRAFT_699755 [Zopfia rhizophila CBS 207.26]